jgi:hypothetical protein
MQRKLKLTGHPRHSHHPFGNWLVAIVAIVMLALVLAAVLAISQPPVQPSASIRVQAQGQVSSPSGPRDPRGTRQVLAQAQGSFQEQRVRETLVNDGYEQPFGSSDAEIRTSLNIQDKTADFVGYNRAADRWLVAESKGSDIRGAVDQLGNTVKALFNTDAGATARNTEIRLYTSPEQFSKALQNPESSNGLGGYFSRDGYLGYYNEANEWIYQTINDLDLRIVVQIAP